MLFKMQISTLKLDHMFIRVFLKMFINIFMALDFILIAQIPDPIMYVTPGTRFNGIDDVKYIKNFNYRNLLDPFFHFFHLKDSKEYKSKNR